MIEEPDRSNSVPEIVEVDEMPLTVSVPALDVSEPKATTLPLIVTDDVLYSPLTVSVPALAVTDPRTALVT
jgi:hypothetical protein